MQDPMPRHLRFGRHRLDTVARELHDLDGRPVPLTGKAFDTLCCLIAHRDRVVGKDELIAAVWPGRIVEENNLTQAISALRRGLGDEAASIVTVPGRGYRFAAEVADGIADDVDKTSVLVAPVPPVRDADGPAAAAPDSPPPLARRWTTPVLALALVLVAALGLVRAWPSWGTPAGPGEASGTPSAWPPAAARAPAPAPVTLAVLPFRALTPGPPDPLLELGLAETLISRISGATRLRVRSLASIQRVDVDRVDPLEASRRLGADFVLEGTTQRRGSRVRVNARLLAVSDGRAVWSGTFDEDIDRAFTLQDGLATAVTTALALEPQAMATGLRSPCDGADAVAYRDYLTGRYQLDRPSAERMRQALAAFKRAVDRDPTCARAYAGMAFAYRALVMTGDEEPRERFAQAQAAVDRALAIDPDLPEALASLGFIRFWYDWDWPGAEAALTKAIAHNPSSVEARMAYAHLLSNLGRNKQAAEQARQAIALDPLSPLVLSLSAAFFTSAGHADEARRTVRRVVELEPDFWTAHLIGGNRKLQDGDARGAIADLRRARELCGGCSQATSVLGAAYAATGDRAAAQAILAQMERRDREGYLPATSRAAVPLALGDRARALDLLERAYEERDVRMPFLFKDTRWTALHGEPRFQALLQKMHFVPVARQ